MNICNQKLTLLILIPSYLLERRADPLLRDSEENIALHWAAFSGSEEISEKLLNSGCDVNCLNIHGDTPLYVLCIPLPTLKSSCGFILKFVSIFLIDMSLQGRTTCSVFCCFCLEEHNLTL